MSLVRPKPAALPETLAPGVNDPAYPGEAFLDLLIREHRAQHLPRLQRLWDYYRNPMTECLPTNALARPYRLAQEQGLPPRLRHHEADAPHGSPGCEREIVIENDIAWRIHALVDFMFGRPPVIQSLAPDPARASLIERFLRRIFELNGGVVFFQNLALLGSVYGYVDVLLRFDASRILVSAPADPQRFADRFVLETLEAPRIIPVLHPGDYRRLDAWVLHYRQPLNAIADEPPLLDRLRDRALGRPGAIVSRAVRDCTEVYTADTIARYHANASATGAVAQPRRLVRRSINPLGVIPVVHIQNLPQPFMYEGLSEVEPLIALQDELNTRLSDRANRITFQSFRMYLGKGIEGFTDRPIGPGQMWSTDNVNASIQEFGGDGNAPSENAHIAEIRQAMDKTSSVTPVAAGMLQGKVGNLTSENALRMTMLGLLARTEKKRVTYGDGLQRLCRLILHAADLLNILPNHPDERAIHLDWPNPLPENTSQRLHDAQVKRELGIPQRQILAELGYAETALET